MDQRSLPGREVSRIASDLPVAIRDDSQMPANRSYESAGLIRRFTLVLAVVANGGCATIIKGADQSVPISSDPASADVLLDGTLLLVLMIPPWTGRQIFVAWSSKGVRDGELQLTAQCHGTFVRKSTTDNSPVERQTDANI